MIWKDSGLIEALFLSWGLISIKTCLLTLSKVLKIIVSDIVLLSGVALLPACEKKRKNKQRGKGQQNNNHYQQQNIGRGNGGHRGRESSW